MIYLKKTMLGLKEVGKDEEYDLIAYSKSEKTKIDEQHEGQSKAIKELQKIKKSNEEKIVRQDEELRQLRKENMVLKATKSEYVDAFEEEKRKNGNLQDMLGREARKRYEAEALNENLKRICKERANQSHKIKPKKEKSGYKVKSSAEKVATYTVKPNKKESVTYSIPYWETTIMTPIDGSINLDLIKDDINDFINDKRDEIGIYQGLEYNEPQIKGVLDHNDEIPKVGYAQDNEYIMNFMFNFIFYRKFQNVNGYWEIIISHTLPLVDIWKLEEPLRQYMTMEEFEAEIRAAESQPIRISDMPVVKIQDED